MNKSQIEARLQKLEEQADDQNGHAFITLSAVFEGDTPKGTVYKTPDEAVQAYQRTHKANILILDDIAALLEIREREGTVKPLGFQVEYEVIV